jgi:hypothetical protein
VLGEIRRTSRCAAEAVMTLALATTVPAWSYAIARSSPDCSVKIRIRTRMRFQYPSLMHAN